MNLQYPSGVTGRDYNADLGVAVNADETALFGTNNACFPSDLLLSQTTAPAAPTVTQGGTAATTNYSYGIGSVANVGLAMSAATQTTTGPATLNTTNFNIISWTGFYGQTYNVYRTASSGTPSTTGLIYTITLSPSLANPIGTSIALSFVDNGGVTPTGNVPTGNTTGCIKTAGPVFPGSVNFGLGLPLVLSTVGAATLTMAQFLCGVIVRTGTQVGGFTDTTPTAVALVAALPGVQVGHWVDLYIRNTTGQTHTLAGGTGVTLQSGNTNTTPTVNGHSFRIVVTNVTSGSEAVTIFSLDAPSAY